MIDQAIHNETLFVKEEEDRKVTSPQSTHCMSQSDYDTCESDNYSWKGFYDYSKPNTFNRHLKHMSSFDSLSYEPLTQQSLLESLSANFGHSPLKFNQIPQSYIYEDPSAYLSYINSASQYYQNSLEDLLKHKLLVDMKIEEELAKIRINNERTQQMAKQKFNECRKIAGNPNLYQRNFVPEYKIEETNKRPAMLESINDVFYGKKVKMTDIESKVMPKEKEEIEVSKPQQSKWKNFPGHVMFGIKRGCQSYFGEEKGIKLNFIERILSEKKEVEDKFKEFIDKYKSVWKTYQTIGAYINNEGDKEISSILIRMIIELLSEENSKDFEAWLEETRMNEKTKDAIRKGKETIKKDFISRLCQKNTV